MSQQNPPTQGGSLASIIAAATAAAMAATGQAPSQGSAPATPAGGVVTLRYGPNVVEVPFAEVGNHDLGSLFAAKSAALGLSDTSNASIRQVGNGVVEARHRPQAGESFIMSIARETKG